MTAIATGARARAPEPSVPRGPGAREKTCCWSASSPFSRVGASDQPEGLTSAARGRGFGFQVMPLNCHRRELADGFNSLKPVLARVRKITGMFPGAASVARLGRSPHLTAFLDELLGTKGGNRCRSMSRTPVGEAPPDASGQQRLPPGAVLITASGSKLEKISAMAARSQISLRMKW
jgi:hypothetical protein